MLKYLLSISLLLIVSSLSVFSQAEFTTESVDSVKMKFSNPNLTDTSGYKPAVFTSFKYSFIPKDTLFYRAISRDSIVINYGTPLLKDRVELLQVICDSIKTNGNYCLQISLVGFESNENEVGGEMIKRTETPWLGRKVFIEIDSVGYRYEVMYDDSNKVGMSPGGAFQPNLFFPFKYSNFQVGNSWMVQDIDYLAENGLPCPALRSNYLFTNNGTIDTLNENCNRFEFIKTSQGSINLPPNPGEKEGLRITSIIAAGGVVDISNSRNLLIHQMQTMEQKLSIHKTKDDVIPGKHFITTFYTLISYNKFLDKNAKSTKKTKKNKK